MVAIRQIIAVGCLLASAGCGPRYPFAGNWAAERNVDFAPGTDPSVATSLKRVKLEVTPEARFTLIDGSIPLEGAIDFGSKSQELDVELLAGQRTDRVPGSAKPSCHVTFRDDDSIELITVGKPPVILHRVPKPSGP